MKRTGGRPRLDPDAPSVSVSVRLTPKQFDATQKQAAEARMTMRDWIREMLARGGSVPKTRP
jgi:hypothetical protein